MAKPGPKPLPANVHMLRGNPSKIPMSALMDEFRPEVAMPDCPAFLLADAKKEWKRLTPHLLQYGLVSELDRGILAMLCQEYARYQWAEKKMAEANKKDMHGQAGFIQVAPSGFEMQSVHLQISRRSVEIYEKLISHFGFSPATRSRVTPSDPQMPLPGMDGATTPAGPAAAPTGFSAL